MLSTHNRVRDGETAAHGRFAAGALARQEVTLRQAQPADLGAVNALIERAIRSWGLPERVRRIGLPLYLYHAGDLGFLELILAEDADGEIVGVAAWEPANPGDAPRGCSALLLHGIYVEPRWHRHGIGTRLLGAALQAAADANRDGLLAKAQADAIPFFEAIGLDRLAVEDPARDYPHRFWRPVNGA